MNEIEATKTRLRGVLPRGYQKLEKGVLLELVRLFAPLPRMVSGDAFGLIYEYFLAEFAANEGRRGGEFFTPQSIVRLIVDVIEPFHGRVYDPACGSGGMFVHSARFVANHSGSPTRDLAVYGQEQKEGTVPLGRMNLALHDRGRARTACARSLRPIGSAETERSTDGKASERSSGRNCRVVTGNGSNGVGRPSGPSLHRP